MMASAMMTSVSSAAMILTRIGVRPDSRRRFPRERSSQDAGVIAASYEEGRRST